MSVSVAADGPVCVVTIDRPDVRNAVDGPTAAALAAAFRSFEADASLSVAVLTGSNGTFCAGADLKAITDGRGNRVDRDMAVDGPMGPSRMMLSKPVIAAVEGFAVAGGLVFLLMRRSQDTLFRATRRQLCVLGAPPQAFAPTRIHAPEPDNE